MHPNSAWCSCVVVCDAGTVAYCQEEHETDREKETGKDTHGEKRSTCRSISVPNAEALMHPSFRGRDRP
jgi:hypothetical protein